MPAHWKGWQRRWRAWSPPLACSPTAPQSPGRPPPRLQALDQNSLLHLSAFILPGVSITVTGFPSSPFHLIHPVIKSLKGIFCLVANLPASAQVFWVTPWVPSPATKHWLPSEFSSSLKLWDRPRSTFPKLDLPEPVLASLDWMVEYPISFRVWFCFAIVANSYHGGCRVEALLPLTCWSQEDETWAWKLSCIDVSKKQGSHKDNGQQCHLTPH